MLRVPTRTAPAASSRAIKGESSAAGRRLALIFEPASVASPATSIRFLTAKGTPASGPADLPCAMPKSMARALLRARSVVRALKALSAPSCCLMRSSVASRTASAVMRPLATAPAMSAAVRQASMTSSLKHRRRLELVGQIELRDLLREPPDHLQMRLYLRLPGRFDRQRQGSGGRCNEGIERPILRFAHAVSSIARQASVATRDIAPRARWRKWRHPADRPRHASLLFRRNRSQRRLPHAKPLILTRQGEEKDRNGAIRQRYAGGHGDADGFTMHEAEQGQNCANCGEGGGGKEILVDYEGCDRAENEPGKDRASTQNFEPSIEHADRAQLFHADSMRTRAGGG